MKVGFFYPKAAFFSAKRGENHNYLQRGGLNYDF